MVALTHEEAKQMCARIASELDTLTTNAAAPPVALIRPMRDGRRLDLMALLSADPLFIRVVSHMAMIFAKDPEKFATTFSSIPQQPGEL